ncbi:MAG: ATP-binding protein, partial [Proteobacteria bacterium]|nr:ATP-binding protein [Pseudomonadota bacterium]
FRTDGPINLKGEYEFYWKQFLIDESLLAATPEHFALVPKPWNAVEIDGEPVGGHGYATYRLNILLSSRDMLAFKFKDFGTAYRVVIEGTVTASVGRPANRAEGTVARYDPQIIFYRPVSNRIELVLHVANFNHRSGGAWEPVMLGLSDDIIALRQNRLAVDLLIVGALFMIGFYQLVFFLFRRDDRGQSSLFLGLYCLIAALRILSVEERFLLQLIPMLDWGLFSKIEYASWFLLLPLITHFMRLEFPDEIHRIAVYITDAVIGLLLLIVLLTPLAIHSWTAPVGQLLNVALFLYIGTMLIRARIRRREGSGVLLFGFGILFACVVNDLLGASWITLNYPMMGIGVLIFVLCQSVLLSYRYASTVTFVELQGKTLATTALKLQTQEKLRHEAEQQTRRTEQQYEKSQQFEALGLLAHGVVRDLKDSFEKTAAETDAIAKAVSGNKELLQALEQTRLVTHHSVSVIEDLLSLSSFEGDQRRVSDLNMVIDNYVNSSQCQELLQSRNLEIQVDPAPELPMAAGSRLHIQRIIENLLVNAAEGNPADGIVRIGTDFEQKSESTPLYYDKLAPGNYVVLSVSDRGTTINHDELDLVFQPFFVRQGSARQSAGLGMSVVRALVSQLKGGIDVLSEPGGETRFDIYLRVASR